MDIKIKINDLDILEKIERIQMGNFNEQCCKIIQSEIDKVFKDVDVTDIIVSIDENQILDFEVDCDYSFPDGLFCNINIFLPSIKIL